MVKISAIQPHLKVGAVDNNLQRIEGLIRDAYQSDQPDIIVLPEAMTSPNVYAAQNRYVPQTLDGSALRFMRNLAQELNIILSGGFLCTRGQHAYGTYVLVEPDGTTHLHDKDIPTAWEHHFYKGGSDDGVIDCATLNCKVGLMSGWEWARFATAQRVRQAGVKLVLGGMCWYSMPTNWYGLAGRWMRKEHDIYKQQSYALPQQVARLTGVPVVHAAHVGAVRCKTPLLPWVNWETEMVGETQICNQEGLILARLSMQDGEGFISASVELTTPKPLDAIQHRYWIPDMTATSSAAWHLGNIHGDMSYRLRHALKAFPWQRHQP